MADWISIPRRFLEWEFKTLLKEEIWKVNNVSRNRLYSVGILDKEKDEYSYEDFSYKKFWVNNILLQMKKCRIKIKSPANIFSFFGLSEVYVFDGKIKMKNSHISINGRYRLNWMSRVFMLIWWNGVIFWYVGAAYLVTVKFLEFGAVRFSEGPPPWWVWLVVVGIPVFGYFLMSLTKAFSGGSRRRVLNFLTSLAE